MCNENEWIVRKAYLAYLRDDLPEMMELVDPQLEWTYLDRAAPEPCPKTRRGRDELSTALRWQSERGLKAEIQEVIASGDHVIMVTRTPGVGDYRREPAGDLTFDVVTVRDGRIVALRGCRDRDEARVVAGLG